MRFFEELKKRNVYKTATAYAVTGWLLLQITDVLGPSLGWSDSATTLLLKILLVGFPIALVLAWIYELTPKGFKRTGSFQKETVDNEKAGRRLNYFIIGILAAALSLMLVERLFFVENTIQDSKMEPGIAILPFHNRMASDNEKNDLIGDMAVDWIIHGITRNDLGQVISPETIEEYSDMLTAGLVGFDQTSLLKEQFNPSHLIEGDYYLDGDRLIFQCAITDGITGKKLISFEPVTCASASPLDCIEELNQRILGYFITEEDHAKNLEVKPPKFEAYQAFLKALSFRGKDPEAYLDFLESSIAKDPDYFEPELYRFMHYYNYGEYQVADSLITALQLKTGIYPRQRQMLDLYDAMLRGDHRNTYRYQREEYNITPMHLETNSNMMVVSLQLVNLPQGVDSIYRKIDMEEADLTKCPFCIERYKMQAMAQIEMKDYDSAIALLSPLSKHNFENIWILKRILIRAYIRSGDFDGANTVLNSLITPVERPELLPETMLFAALDYLREGASVEAFELLDKTIEAFRDTGDARYRPALRDYRLGEALFYRQAYGEALPYLEKGYQSDSLDFNYGALYAISLKKTGQDERAGALLNAMKSLKADFQFGEMYYSLAQYYGATDQKEKCLEYLLRAISEGHWYETGAFQNDPLLKDVADTPEFQRVMTYWQ